MRAIWSLGETGQKMKALKALKALELRGWLCSKAVVNGYVSQEGRHGRRGLYSLMWHAGDPGPEYRWKTTEHMQK